MISLLISACAEIEPPLEGQRLDLRAPLDQPLDETGQSAAVEPVAQRIVPLSLSAPRVNADWTHKSGTATHRIQHPAFDGRFQLLWSADIGAGNSRKRRLTADPIVVGNTIFTLDSGATVTAFNTRGQPVWQTNLTPRGENPDDASGGGLAYANGRLFVSLAFGTLSALNPATGQVLWVQELDAAASGAPTAVNDQVFIVSADSRAWGIDARNGRVRWNVPGAQSESGLTGAPSPAVTGSAVVLPFSSGQLVAANRGDGARLWATSVAGQRLEQAFARVLDIQGDPVVLGDRVYVANSAGRTVAVNLADGQRLWTQDNGTFGPLWVDGGSIFLVSDRNELLRLNSSTGEIIWSASLPFFVPVRREAKLKDTFVHFGPIIAGNRLIIASDDELLRVFNPQNGELIQVVPLPGSAARNPVVAGGVLYLVTADGRLHAFR